MELGTIAIIITAILGVVGSIAGFTVGKKKVEQKIRQAGEVFTASKEALDTAMQAFADNTVTEKELKDVKEKFENAWRELQELLGTKKESTE